MQNVKFELHFAFFHCIGKIADFSVYNKVKFPWAVRLRSNLHMWRIHFSYKVQLEVDRFLKETTIKLNMKEE